MDYKFTDTTEVSQIIYGSSNKLIFDGINIDDELTTETDICVTANVWGRGLIDKRIDSVTPLAYDGALQQGSTLDTRTLTVEMYLKSDNNNNFRKLYEKLNKLLFSKEIVPIQFSDELDRMYYGIFSSGENPEERKNEQVIKLELFCADPYKYSPQKMIEYTNSNLLDIDTDYPVRPRFEIVLSSESPYTITNTTTNKKIIVGGTTDVINNVDLSKSEVTRGIGAREFDNLKNLNINSDFEDFTVDKGDQVVIQPAPTRIRLYYEGVFL